MAIFAACVLLGTSAYAIFSPKKSNSPSIASNSNDEYLTFSSPQLTGFSFDFDTVIWKTPELADITASHGYQLFITAKSDSNTRLLITFSPISNLPTSENRADSTACYTSDEITHVGNTWNRVINPNTKTISYRQDNIEIYDYDGNKRSGTQAESSCSRNNLVKLSKDLGSQEVNSSQAAYISDGITYPLSFSIQLQSSKASDYVLLTDSLISTLKF